MTAMDPNSSSWFDQVYEKFEAMGLEVEDIIYQGPVKYVENQVKTVGACVKKFYTETMEDFLPESSINPVTTENPGSSSVHHNCDVEKVHIESGDAYLASKLDECILRNLSELQSQEPTALVQQNNNEVLALSEKIFYPVSESTLLSKDDDCLAGDDEMRTEMEERPEYNEQIARNSTDLSLSDRIIIDCILNDEDVSKLSNGVIYEQIARNSTDLSASDRIIIDSILNDADMSKFSNGVIYEQIAQNSTNLSSSDRIIRDDMLNDEDILKLSNVIYEQSARNSTNLSSSDRIIRDDILNDEDVSKFSDDCYERAEDEIDIDDYFNEALEDSEQRLGEMELDESCVLVDKYEQFFISQPEAKRRSYKKKIKDVLYMRRWSSNRNHERENSASSNLGSGKITVSSSALESSNSLESGWEFL